MPNACPKGAAKWPVAPIAERKAERGGQSQDAPIPYAVVAALEEDMSNALVALWLGSDWTSTRSSRLDIGSSGDPVSFSLIICPMVDAHY